MLDVMHGVGHGGSARGQSRPIPRLIAVGSVQVVEYLLKSAHPDNGGKAQFFKSLGFAADHPELLIDALLEVAQTGEVVESVKSFHGEKYVVGGAMSSHTEMRPTRMVRTVWIIDRGLEAPRLVTAYPGKE